MAVTKLIALFDLMFDENGILNSLNMLLMIVFYRVFNLILFSNVIAF